MPILVPDVGEVLLLRITLGVDSSPASLFYRYFVNDYTPVEGTVLGDLTECTTMGYAPMEMDAGDWSVATSIGVTTAEQDPQAVVLEAAITIYGYYVTDNPATVLYYLERFADPVVFGALGGTLTFVPKVTFS